ncbi:unnamed protein product [Arctogadus glacialis]
MTLLRFVWRRGVLQALVCSPDTVIGQGGPCSSLALCHWLSQRMKRRRRAVEWKSPDKQPSLFFSEGTIIGSRKAGTGWLLGDGPPALPSDQSWEETRLENIHKTRGEKGNQCYGSLQSH